MVLRAETPTEQLLAGMMVGVMKHLPIEVLQTQPGLLDEFKGQEEVFQILMNELKDRYPNDTESIAKVQLVLDHITPQC